MLKMLGGFFATGTQVVYSQYAAKGLHRKANEAFTVSAVIMAFFSCLAALVIFVFSDQLALLLGASEDAAHLQQYTSDYLRGLAVGLPVNLGVLLLMPLMNIDGDKKRIAISINVMLAVNTAGDLFVAIFMNGNIFGLALVTSISYLCALTVLLLHFRKGSSIHLVRSDNPLVLFSEISKAGVIPAVTRSFSMIRSYALNIIFITFAGAGVLAANTLVQSNIKTVPMCVATAIGTSTLAISGVLYEERDKRGLCQLFRSVFKISFGPCLLIAALVFVLAPQIVALFGARDISALTVLALRCYIVGLPLIGVKMFFIYYFQSARKKLLSYYSSVAGEMVFLVACAVVMNNLIFANSFKTFRLLSRELMPSGKPLTESMYSGILIFLDISIISGSILSISSNTTKNLARYSLTHSFELIELMISDSSVSISRTSAMGNTFLFLCPKIEKATTFLSVADVAPVSSSVVATIRSSRFASRSIAFCGVDSNGIRNSVFFIIHHKKSSIKA